MNNSISPLSSNGADPASTAGTANSATKTSALPPPPDTATPPTSTQAGEAVTLSTDAQTTAALLEAARNAEGVDQTRVTQLKTAVQSGAYHVSPDDLAKAIAGSVINGATSGGVSGNAP